MQRIRNEVSIVMVVACAIFGGTQRLAAQQPPPPSAPPPAATTPAPETLPPPPSAPAPAAQPAAPPPPPPTYADPSYDHYAATGGREFVFEPESSSYDNPMRPHNEAEFMLGVPIWLSSEDSLVDPGVSFEARFARRFGAVAPEFTMGWQINWIDEDKLGVDFKNTNITVDALFFELGVRIYPIPKARVISPFISGAFDLYFWHITGNEDIVCGYYYCSTVANYEASVGFSGRFGIAIRATQAMQLELGAKIGMTFPMGPIDQTESWITPFVGFNALM